MLKIANLNVAAPEVENPYPYPLDPFQKYAFDAINKHENVLVTAKTGSGKTLVGEYQIKVSLEKKKRVFYTTPIKTLSNQKFHDLKELGYSVGIMTGDIKFAPQADVVVMTTEILCNLLFKKDTPNESFIELTLNDVDAIVFDEVHYINDPDRGKVWEQCLMLLPPEINLVLLSATIAQPEVFASWLGDVKQKPVHLISTQYRVVPLVHMVEDEVVMNAKDVFDGDAYRRWLISLETQKKKEKEHQKKVADRRRDGYSDGPVSRDQKSHSYIHRINALVKKLESQALLPALFFVFSRAKCEEYAGAIQSDLLTGCETADVRHIIDFHLHKYPHVLKTGQYFQLRSLLEKGIAFHHSGLLPILKEIVEILFSKGFIKLLFATETFAVGINMPTKTVVFTSYTKHDDSGLRMLRSDEYIQMAGRAGRRGKDDKGIVMYLPDREPASLEEVKKMMTGGSQKISSKMDFGYDFLIKTFNGHSMDWRDIAAKSFWYAQTYEGIKRTELEIDTLYEQRNNISISDVVVADIRHVKELEEKVVMMRNASRKTTLNQIKDWYADHSTPMWKNEMNKFQKYEILTSRIRMLEEESLLSKGYHAEIEDRIAFLNEHNFLEGDLGRLASNVHEGHPLLMPYAFHNKLFHGLSVEQLVGCLAVFSEKDETVVLNECHFLNPETKNRINALIDTVNTQFIPSESKLRLSSDWNLSFYWIDVVIRWLNGELIGTICKDYDIYEGNFIRAMLKIANLVDEWITMATIAGDLEQLELTKDLRQKIVRDVVVPESLYLRL
jgi:superfamily II RNA helicase